MSKEDKKEELVSAVESKKETTVYEAGEVATQTSPMIFDKEGKPITVEESMVRILNLLEEVLEAVKG